MPKLHASIVPAHQLDVLDEARDRLPAGELRTTLEALSRALRGGEDALVMTDNETFTPSEAAKQLGVSRAHLYKILDSGALAFHVVGNRDRRIAAADLDAYRERMFAAQKRVAEDAARADDVDDLALNEF